MALGFALLTIMLLHGRAGAWAAEVVGSAAVASWQPWIRGAFAAGLSVFFAFFVASLSLNPYPVLLHAAARRGLESADRNAAVKRGLTAYEAALNRASIWNGIALAIVALAAPVLAAKGGLNLAAALSVGAIAAATVLDAREEGRARARGGPVALGEAPGTLEADRIAGALAAAGVPCLMRGAASRLLFGIFGLFVPLTVLVGAGDLPRAREALEREAPFLAGSPALDAALDEAPPPA